MLSYCLPQSIPRVLSELPQTMDETYERVLNEIEAFKRHQAHRLLQCLVVAIRPLRIEELAEILALDFDNTRDGLPQLIEDWRWDDQEEAVLTTCSSLITVVNDDSQRVVQFSHFSVKEFLTSGRLAAPSAEVSHFRILPEPAHTVIAKSCLGILLQLDDGVGDVEEKRLPLAEYAAKHWVDHAQFEKVSTHVEDGTRRLFDPAAPHFSAWLKLYDIDEGWTTFADRGDECRGSPLYYASMCGFHDLIERLIDEHPGQVNDLCGRCLSPLVTALHKRHFDVAELLYQRGADVGITGYGNLTPLHAASMDGSVDIAEWLLAHGVDAMSQQDDGHTPLHLAARNGRLEFVRMLMGHGVILDGRNKEGRTPLHLASEFGHAEIVWLLLRHGADIVTQDPSRGTPLYLALSNPSPRSAEKVRLLIEYGADVDPHDERRTSDPHPEP
jgi:ankyrin repeat protein